MYFIDICRTKEILNATLITQNSKLFFVKDLYNWNKIQTQFDL